MCNTIHNLKYQYMGYVNDQFLMQNDILEITISSKIPCYFSEKEYIKFIETCGMISNIEVAL